MSAMFVLTAPTLRLASAFSAFADDYAGAGDRRYEDAARDVAAYVRRCENHAAGEALPSGWVPQSTFWLVRDDQCIVGCSRLRHRLTPALSCEGGHIGYDIRPGERGHGYGHVLLRMTLRAARLRGLQEVLITADEANAPSWKLIERAGGRREADDFIGRHGPFRRYWVPTV